MALDVSTAILRLQPVNCKKGTRLLVIRGPRQRNNSWTDAQRMAMLDSIMVEFQCTVYIIQDPPNAKKCDEVFDGAHKLETVCDFVMNQFPIKKVKTDMINWETSPLAPYIGKYYRDLSEPDQLIFDNYSFIVNVIPPSIAENTDQLTSLWIRLNNSGNEVNEYESYIQIYPMFYRFLSEHTDPWFKTAVFKGDSSPRGQLETELMKLLALSEPVVSPKFQSQIDIYKQWRKNTFGCITSKVDVEFLAKKADLTKRLKHLHVVYRYLDERNCFKKHAKKKELVQRILIGRIAYWCDSVAKLTHCSEPIIEYATMIINKPFEDLVKQFGYVQANLPYQKCLLDMINRDIQDIVTQRDDPRAFTPAQRERKLVEQCGKCPECKEPFLPGQKREAHHIKPYRDGGKTTMDNLEILHAECHKEHHANPNKKRRTE